MKFDEFEQSLCKTGFSKADFCRAIGLSYNSITLWKNKGKTPTWVDSWMEIYAENQMLRSVLRKAGL